ncbi:GDYXXLXY domain-containing protein [Maricaulis sp.]|uniref:GDYXXLXY domain-containing protein n=1 Tax=Maricaulis sp. TaxID=1486257 RepID=UPI0025C670CE|nr:GDYXXLXY domain-containing protein [Maricaulis sp.]
MTAHHPTLHHPLRRLGLVAALMSGFLVFMLASHAMARSQGTELVMAVEGYDPRDIFLGHYARIRTPLNLLAPDMLAGDDSFERHQPVFVTLEVGADGLARPVALHDTHPGEGLVAAGRVDFVGDELHARFNIERYYADRDDALALQDLLRGGVPDGGRIRIILSLTGSGQLMIRGFEIDGERRIDRIW